MTILEISQIIFNLIISLAVIVVTALFTLIAYEIIKFIKVIKQFLADVDRESTEIYEKINKIMESIMTMSFISKFFKKKNKK